jgi:hypothetical protein
MPPLLNARHEAFARAMFEGCSADEAHTKAGYSKNRGNASRMKANESIQSRVAELQTEAARSSAITVESICRELDEANAVAREKGQANAMVSASALRARLAGLLTQKIEVSHNTGMTVDDENTSEDVAIHIAKEAGVNLTPQDLEQFMNLIRGWHEAMQEFIASCRAKQVNAPPIHSERKRLGLAASKQDYR